MSNTTYTFDLRFNANTQNAKKSITELQNLISDTINASISGKSFPMNTQLIQARDNAVKLQIALENAVNIDTGKLNLNKFQSELNKGNLSLKELSENMKILGPQGVQCFQQLTQSIQSADTRLFSLSGSLKKITDTFMNTARWKISTAALDAITSTISSTVQYAKELDASLNNIRIVTGKSAEQMNKFAKEANKAAKALSTTTTEYTDASLIYYQQGLNDSEVKKRTDITIKMANVTKQSVSEVSDQMTAVWNNFYDGSQTLDHFADVMARLGAETASSADEIATGLEKFAAIGQTVGLSFDAASAALATVTAQTRQSADVVGTAFKTIFSRMEQLKQGGTTEEGDTTLGEYSQALANIGVNIKDAEGQLKDMDVIIAETGQRWKLLSNDQQVALSQTVAGIRQYSQFMALMNNYDYYEENLKTAKAANGELQKQNAIYEDSIEASKERIQASLEEIKADLFGGDDLKGLYEFGEKAVEVISKITKSLGGTKGILLLVSSILTKIYQSKIEDFASRTAIAIKDIGINFVNIGRTFGNIISVAKTGEERYNKILTSSERIKRDATQYSSESENSSSLGTEEATLRSKYNKEEEARQYFYFKNQNKMSENEQQLFEQRTRVIRALQEENLKIAKGLDRLELEVEDEITSDSNQITDSNPVTENNITDVKSADINIEKATITIQQAIVEDFNNNNKEDNTTEDEDRKNNEVKSEKKNRVNDRIEYSNDEVKQQALNSVAKSQESYANELQNKAKKVGSGQFFIEESLESIDNLSETNLDKQDRSDLGKMLLNNVNQAEKKISQASLADEDIFDFEGLKKEIENFINGSTVSISATVEKLQTINDQINGANFYGNDYMSQSNSDKIAELSQISYKEANTDEQKSQEILKKFSEIDVSTIRASDEAAEAQVIQDSANAIFNNKDWQEQNEKIAEQIEQLKILEEEYSALKQKKEEANAVLISSVDGEEDKNEAAKQFGEAEKELIENEKKYSEIKESLNISQKEQAQTEKKITSSYIKKGKTLKDLAAITLRKIKTNKIEIKDDKQLIKETEKKIKIGNKEGKLKTQLIKNEQKLNKENGKAKKQIQALSQSFIQAGSAVLSCRFGLNMLKSSVSSLTSMFAKGKFDVTTFFTSILSGVGGVVRATKSLQDLVNVIKKISGANEDAIDSNEKKSQSDMDMAQQAKNSNQQQAKSSDEATEDILENSAEKIAADTAGGTVDATVNAEKIAGDNAVKESDDAEADNSVKNDGKRAAGKIPEIISNIAKWFSKGPIGWAVAAISLAGIAALGISIGSGIKSGAAEAEEEKVNEDYEYASEKTDKNLSYITSINENQETSKELTASISDYNKIKQAGEDTKSQFDDVIASVNTLINSYQALQEELGKELEINIDTTQLEKAEEYFKVTGDSSLIEQEQAILDEKIKQAKKISAENAVNSAKVEKASAIQLFAIAAEKMDIDTDNSGKDFSFDLTNDSDVIKFLKNNSKVGKDWSNKAIWDGDDLIIDVTNDQDILDKYQLIEDSIQELYENGKTDSDFYEELVQIRNTLADSVEKIKESNDKLETTILEQMTIDIDSTDSIIQNINNKQFKDIDTLKEYKEQRQQLIQELMKTYGAENEETIIAYLKQSNVFGNFEDLIQTFSEDSDRYKQLFYNGGEELVTEIQSWYDTLPDETKTIALGLDYRFITNEEDAKQQLNETLKDLKISNLIDKAVSIDTELDKTTVETYIETLQSLNSTYADNEEAAAQAATMNIVLQQSLEGLAEIWEENIKVVRENKKGSIEYAKALANLKTKLQEAFGVDLSNAFLENERNLEILQEIVDGNLDSLGELQKAAAKDYVANMSFTLSEDVSAQKADEWRNQIQEMLNSIDTSLEFGQDVSIAPEYFEILQTMLDAGAITADQLDNMFNAAGVTITYDYKWIDGPAKVYATWDGVSLDDVENLNFNDATTYSAEVSQIQVPVVSDSNGNKSNVKVTKGAAPSTLNASSISSSGSGESSSTKDKTYGDEIERNHYLKKQIDDLAKQYDRLSNAKDRAYGKAKLKAINQSIDLIDKQIAKQKELINAQEQQVSGDAALLKGYGATFDENGNISNYDQLMQQQIDKYNANKDSDTAEENYQNFLDALSNYEESREELVDSYDSLTDLTYQRLDAELEGIEYKISFRVELNERDLNLVEHQLSKIEDQAFNGAQTISLLFKKTDALMSNSDIYKEGINDILKSAGATEDQINRFYAGDVSALQGLTFTENQMSKLMEQSDNLLSTDEELVGVYKEMHEELMNTFDEQNEEFDRLAGKVDYLSSKVQNYRDIIDLVGKDSLGVSDSLLDELNKTNMKASLTNTQIAKQKLDTQKKELEIVKKEYQKALETGNESAITQYGNAIKQLTEEVQNSELAVQESLKSSLEQAATIFEDTVTRAAEAFSKAMGGIKDSLEELKEAFDFQKSESELYLQDYKKIYETSKLIRNINKSIDSTDNIKYQKELNKLAKQVAEYQKEGKKMSDYDLQYLQKKYDLTLAQQALEDAKNAKDTVRLQRTASGSYGYVYTANQDNISQAEQKVEDAQQALDELNYNAELAASEKYISLQSELSSKLKEVKASDYKTQEEYNQKLKEITEHYRILMSAQLEKLSEVMKNTGKAYNETILGQMYPDYLSFEELSQAITDNIVIMSEDLTEAWRDYEINVNSSFEAAGETVDGYKNTVNTDMKSINDDIDDTIDSSEELRKQCIKTFNDAAWAVKEWEKTYSEKLADACDSNDLLATSINNLAEAYNKLKEASGQSNEIGIEASGQSNEIGIETSSSTNKNDDKKSEIPENTSSTFTAASGEERAEYYNNRMVEYHKPTIDIYQNNELKDSEDISTISKNGKAKTASDRWGDDSYYGGRKYFTFNGETYIQAKTSPDQWYKKSELSSDTRTYTNKGRESVVVRSYWIGKNQQAYNFYKTGGLVPYTGPAWVDGTPTAPEAFLNPLQTKLIGNLAEQLQLNAMSMKLNYKSLGYTAPIENNLQQEVTIHAEFPNATNHSEIEEAFNTLINRASQYVNYN